jgi:HEAT repeat protein
MRIAITLVLLSFAVAGVPAAQPPMPPAPMPATGTPSDAAIDTLIAETLSRDMKVATEARKKLIDLGPAAVPAITQGLWADSATRRVCLELIMDIGADARSATASLLRLTTEPDSATRVNAIRALGAVGAHSAIPELAKFLEDKTTAIRLAAVESLIALSADAATVIPVLTKSLKSDEQNEVYIAVRLFAQLGPEAAPAFADLNAALPAADALLTAYLAATFAQLGESAKDAIPTLKKKVKEDKAAPLFRTRTAIALWRINRDPDTASILRDGLSETKGLPPHAALWRIDQSQETLDALAKQLKSDDAAIAIPAAATLGARSKDSVPTLLKHFKPDLDIALAQETINAFGDIGPAAKEAVEQLQPIAKLKAPGISIPAAVAVNRITRTPQSALAIAEYLEDKELRLEATEALKALRPTGQAVVVELLHALDTGDDQLRLAAAIALWRIEKHELALPAAIKRLRSPDAKVRSLAATDIGGEFGSDAKTAVPELVKRLFDPFATVRSASAEALGRIGVAAQPATQPLLALLEGNEPAFVQSAACEALGLISPIDKTDTLAILKKKLDHPDALVRVHAALALFTLNNDKVGEQEAVAGLKNRSHAVRITAAETLWRISRDPRAIPLLVATLEEANLEGTPFENERYMAARALGRMGNAAKVAVPELLKLINHRDIALATAARTAIKAIDPEAAKKAGLP